MILMTPRLVLRPYSMEHLEAMNKWANDPDLNYYDDDRPEPTQPVALEKTAAMLRRIVDSRDEGIIRFAIHKQEDHAFIGICMIALIDRHNRRCNLG
ncbi:MAG TPA: GNAT family N-acetyltransferase, partial [Bacillota bacterium]|nr:GNAT family N-acetyltransferase [Bacillota bacterium]